VGVSLTPFEAHETEVEGLVVMNLKQVSDERGTVREFYRRSTHSAVGAGLSEGWAQLNVTYTRRGAIRGLHGEAITKLVGVVAGRAFGAYVDTRSGSSSYGKVVTLPLEVGIQVLVPAGVLNGFQATGDEGCEYLYGFDSEWQPDIPGIGVSPLDPDLGIPWPITIDPADRSLLSAKDAGLPRLAELGGGA
jgi:dTDP-4-dehydrorhamnose 3,5-epimerase